MNIVNSTKNYWEKLVILYGWNRKTNQRTQQAIRLDDVIIIRSISNNEVPTCAEWAKKRAESKKIGPKREPPHEDKSKDEDKEDKEETEKIHSRLS